MTEGEWRRPDGEPEPFSYRWWQWAYQWISSDFFRAARAERECGPRRREDQSRSLLTGLTIAGIAAMACGLIFNVEGFLAHVVAGFAGLVLGAVLAVSLIERMLNERRRTQWHAVREAIQRMICEGVVNLGTAYARAVDSRPFIGLAGPENAALPHPEISEALKDLCADVEEKRQQLASKLDADISSSRALYRDAAPALARFGPDTTTRVIVLGDEPDLVEALLVLERAEHQWRVWIEAVERSGAPDRFAWNEALATLVAATAVYGYFVVS